MECKSGILRFRWKISLRSFPLKCYKNQGRVYLNARENNTEQDVKIKRLLLTDFILLFRDKSIVINLYTIIIACYFKLVLGVDGGQGWKKE